MGGWPRVARWLAGCLCGCGPRRLGRWVMVGLLAGWPGDCLVAGWLLRLDGCVDYLQALNMNEKVVMMNVHYALSCLEFVGHSFAH